MHASSLALPAGKHAELAQLAQLRTRCSPQTPAPTRLNRLWRCLGAYGLCSCFCRMFHCLPCLPSPKIVGPQALPPSPPSPQTHKPLCDNF